MAIIKNIFVVWLSDFEIDVKKAGLKIIELNHNDDCPGYDITLGGDIQCLYNFIKNIFCEGMGPEEVQEIINSIQETN